MVKTNVHEEAEKIRNLSDEELLEAVKRANMPEKDLTLKKPNNDTSEVKKLLDGLSRGECRGVKGATVYKIYQYAEETGLI